MTLWTDEAELIHGYKQAITYSCVHITSFTTISRSLLGSISTILQLEWRTMALLEVANKQKCPVELLSDINL